MDAGSASEFFLGTLLLRWKMGLSEDEALKVLTEWANDPIRTNEELDAAQKLEQEIKHRVDPWIAAQNYISIGRWEDARAALLAIQSNHPRFAEVPSLFNAIADGKLYDQIPGLRRMLGLLPSSRSRRDWWEFDLRRKEAEDLIQQASNALGQAIRMPSSLAEILNDGAGGKLADELIEKALDKRRHGDYITAISMLFTAEQNDPRLAATKFQQALTHELLDMLEQLRHNPLTTSMDLWTGLELCEQLLAPNASPNSAEIIARRERIKEKIDKRLEMAWHYIKGMQKTVRTSHNIKYKLGMCDSIETKLAEIEALQPDEPEIWDVHIWLEEMRKDLEALQFRIEFVTDEIAQLDNYTDANLMQILSLGPELEKLAGNPLAAEEIDVIRAKQNFANYINKCLSGKLSTDLDQQTYEYTEVLLLAARLQGALPTGTRNWMIELSRGLGSEMQNVEALKLAVGLLLVDVIAIGDSELTIKVNTLYEALRRLDLKRIQKLHGDLIGEAGVVGLRFNSFFQTPVVIEVMSRATLQAFQSR